MSKTFYKLVYQAINVLEIELLLKLNIENIILKINSVLILENRQIYNTILNTNLYSLKLHYFDIFSYFSSNNINSLIDENSNLNSVNNIKKYINQLINLMMIDNKYYIDNIFILNN